MSYRVRTPVMIVRLCRALAHLGWLRFVCWWLPLMTRIELSLARRFRLGAAYHYWRAGRMIGMPRLPGESTTAYGERLMRHRK